MELRQLAYLIAVLEEGSFTRAAQRVHVAQPGVSAQLRRLERELHAELLDRTGRTVVATSAGAAVLPYARAALAAVGGARHAVDDVLGLLRGQLTLGTVTALSTDAVELPALLADFHRDHPGVEITLGAATTDALLSGVRSGRYDVVLLGLGPVAPADLSVHVVDEQPLVVAVGPNHPLTGARHVDLARLADGLPLGSLPPGSGIRTTLDAAFAAAGLRPHVAFEAADPGTVAQLAAYGLGAALVPRSAVTDPQLHLAEIGPIAPRARVAFAWRASGPHSPATRELLRRIHTIGSGGCASSR